MAVVQSTPGVDPFIPELWHAALMAPYESNKVYTQAGVASTEYTGEITQRGDTVHIGAVSAPTIKSYDESKDLEVEDLTITDNTLVVDQGDYFAFQVGDVSQLQAAGPIKDPAVQQAGIALRDKADKYAAGVLKAGVATANKLGQLTINPFEQGQAWNILVKLRKALNAQSVPTEGRYVILGNEFESALLNDERFVLVNKSGTDQGLRNGIVGRALGFDVLVSNNAPVTAGRETVIAGVPGAFTFVDQLNKIEHARRELRFADLVKGLHIYGAKVIRPEGIAMAEVTVDETAGTATTAPAA